MDPILDGHYSHRQNAIAKCAVAALKKKYRIFAVQHGGQCFGGATAEETFDKYGKSTSCGNDGEGGEWANQVYLTKGAASNSYLTLNGWSLGEQRILFHENFNHVNHVRFEGNKTHCSPRDQSLSDLFYSKIKQKQILKNALRFQRQHQATSEHARATAVNISLVTVHCFPFDVIVFAMLPARGI